MAFWSDDRAIEMALHSSLFFIKKKKKFKFTCSQSLHIPSIKQVSKLHWYPVIRSICLYPIGEEQRFDEIEFSAIAMFRPLFYSELDACRYKGLKKRLALLKRREAFTR